MDKKIGLYFGSFNPISNNHWAIAQSVIEETDVQEVWFILTPESPDKVNSPDMASFDHRLTMLNIMMMRYVEEHNKLSDCKMKPSIIEENMERPCYTYKTLEAIREEHGDNDYVIVMGTDNYQNLDNWSHADQLFGERFMVIPRSMDDEVFVDNIVEVEYRGYGNERVIYRYNYPLLGRLNVSATFVRQRVKEGKSIFGLVPNGISKYIHEHGLYK